MIDIDHYKTCGSCNISKDVINFYKSSKTQSGYQYNCKSCDKIIAKERHNKNRVNRLEKAANKRKDPAYREWCKEYHAKRWKDNKLGIYARNRNWSKNNRDKVSILAAKYRAAKLNATPKWAGSEFDEFIVGEIYHLARLRTAATGLRWTVDHMVPLQSDFVCGLHCAANLQVLTASANSSKNNLWWEDMP